MDQPRGVGLAAVDIMDADFCIEALEEALSRFGRRGIFKADSQKMNASCGAA